MRSAREARKARLMERIETAVDELLDWEEATEKPNLTQIEEKVLKLRKQVSEEMALEVGFPRKSGHENKRNRVNFIRRSNNEKGQKTIHT